MNTQEPVVARYLEAFRDGLRGLPGPETAEILREMEHHITEEIEGGRPVSEVLARLGSAERLARAVTANSILKRPGSRTGNWLTAAGVLTLSSLSSLCIIAVLGLIGVSFCVFGGRVFLYDLLYLIRGDSKGLGVTSTPMGPDPGWDQVLGIGIALMLIFFGVVALVLLARYVKFLVRTVRTVIRP